VKKMEEYKCKFKGSKNECLTDVNKMQCIYLNRTMFTQEEECGMFEKKDIIFKQLKVL